MAWSTTRTRRTGAGSMRFGARTNGSIARRKDETSKVHGGSATTSTRREQRAHQRGASMKKTNGYAPVNGLKMYYEIEGEGDPLGFIPPAFGFAGLKSFPALAKSHAII